MLEKSKIRKGSKDLIVKDKKSFNDKALSIGWIGKFLGEGSHASRNIVAITLTSSFILIIVLMIILTKYVNIGRENSHLLQTILLFLTNITTLAFGYLFGSNN